MTTTLKAALKNHFQYLFKLPCKKKKQMHKSLRKQHFFHQQSSRPCSGLPKAKCEAPRRIAEPQKGRLTKGGMLLP